MSKFQRFKIIFIKKRQHRSLFLLLQFHSLSARALNNYKGTRRKWFVRLTHRTVTRPLLSINHEKYHFLMELLSGRIFSCLIFCTHKSLMWPISSFLQSGKRPWVTKVNMHMIHLRGPLIGYLWYYQRGMVTKDKITFCMQGKGRYKNSYH